MTRLTVLSLVSRGLLRVEDGNHGNDRPRPTEFVPEGIAFIRAADMSSGVVNFETAGRINDVAKARIRKGIGAPGDVILSHKGTVGKVAVAPDDSPEFVCSPQTTFWRSLDQSVINQSYLRYVLASPDFTRQLEVLKGQTDMAPYVSLTDQRSMKITLPAISQQSAIAEVLGALDDKIAANTKLAATADDYIRASLAALSSGVNDIVAIGKLATNRKDLMDPTSLDPTANYVGLEHIPRRSMWLDTSGTAGAVTSTKARFQLGDVLFGKLRPYFHKVVAAPFAGVCSTDILVLTPVFEELSGFVLASVASDHVVERVTAASEGTRMPRTSWKDLSAVEVAWPGEGMAREFSNLVSTLRAPILSLLQENTALAATRDAILPQLMSGNLRVKDAEALATAAD